MKKHRNRLFRRKSKVPPSGGGGGFGIPTSLFLGMTGLKKLIEHCDDTKELNQIYKDNKKRIDADEEVKQTFKSRSLKLRTCAIAYG